MFSVIICSFNKSRSLAAVLTNLNKLVKEERNYSFEVIVVVDGSTDDTLEMLRVLPAKYPLKPFYIEKSGLSKARNFGIRQSIGDYIICCDDDVLFHPDYMDYLSRAIEQHPANVHIGNLTNIGKEFSPGIADDLLKGKELDYIMFGAMQKYHVFFEAAKQLFFYQNSYADFVTATWWAVVTGGNLCIPKQYFDLYGDFDGNIQGWGPEDAELCYRFFLNGVKASYNSSCLLYHLDHNRDLSTIGQTMTKNAVYFIKKHQKPKELYDYLNFTNGKLSLADFNDKCCDLYQLQKVNIPPFSMSMKDYSGREQFLETE